MSDDFGRAPLKKDMQLSKGADYIQTTHTSDGSDLPVGTNFEFRFGDGTNEGWTDGTVWPATIDGDTASWNVDKALVAALRTAIPVGRSLYRLYYVNGAVDELCVIGRVHFNG